MLYVHTHQIAQIYGVHNENIRVFPLKFVRVGAALAQSAQSSIAALPIDSEGDISIRAGPANIARDHAHLIRKEW